MECVIFIGLQGAGKSTFYQQRFSGTHIRVNLDTLKTRHREYGLYSACIHDRLSFVVDNTNPTRAERAKYIDAAKSFGYAVTGYYFVPDIQASMERNERRTGKQRVPVAAIRNTAGRLEQPSADEGFDRLFQVRLVEGQFEVEALNESGEFE